MLFFLKRQTAHKEIQGIIPVYLHFVALWGIGLQSVLPMSSIFSPCVEIQRLDGLACMKSTVSISMSCGPL